jgi:diguanylate cyclase (GGDEF)-like protein
MSNEKILKLSKSIIVKSLLLLVFAMAVVTIGGTYYFANRQRQMALMTADETNNVHLQQMSLALHNELFQFGNQLTLLAKASEIKSMDPSISTSYLKSYNISPLFISGERVSLYNRNNVLICDNAMIASVPAKYPVDFSKITPHRPFVSGWYRDLDNMRPKRAFATVVADNAKGNGSLVASFSTQRLWKLLSESKVGKNGYYIAINSEGEILFHPDLENWLTEPHKIAETGIKGFDPKTDETKGIKFYTLSDKQTYLANYVYDASYDIGLLSLQPKSEIDEQMSSLIFVSRIMLIAELILILLISYWLYRKLVLPMGRFIQHTIEISEGDMEAPDINVGNRQDEIGILAKHFNIMHHTIKRQIAELNAHREMLEHEVQERTKELEEANRKLDLISRTDELTGLPNRRDMNQTIEKERVRSVRTRKPICFIFFDIDHFKNVNDTYGHAAGDAILKAVSNTIRGLLRKYDVLARYGGEEFLTLLPETDVDGAKTVAERFRREVEKMTVVHGDKEIKVTITLGVAEFDNELGIDRSIQRADKALYDGKENGRNRVVVWRPEL